MPYSDYSVVLNPTALRSPYGAAFARALGIVKDHYMTRVRVGTKLRFPDYATPEALGAIGDERLIDRSADTLMSTSETDAQYAARLKSTWKDGWYWGGTAFGMLRALAFQGYSTANSAGPTIIQQNGIWWTLDGSGNLVITVMPAWSFAPPNLWSTFLVMFASPPAPWSSISNPPTPSSIPSADEIAKLVRIINLWRPGHMTCAGIQVVQSGKVWGFPASNTWGTGTWGGTTTIFPVPPTPILP
jgi:hypothetical protein